MWNISDNYMSDQNKKRPYLGMWFILVVTMVLFVAISVLEPIKICGIELRSSGMFERLTKSPEPTPEQVVAAKRFVEEMKAQEEAKKPKYDLSVPQTFLFIGDSMLEGLYPRLAAYAKENGHKVYAVIWYSSTSEIWGETEKLKEYIEQFKPTYIFICLGANELFVKDIKEKRDKFVKNMISQIGDLPYLWIGPPNWKPDTGINELIDANTPDGYFFLSDGMKFDRMKDGAHPTRKSAAQWMDSVLRWMPEKCANPVVNMKIPTEETARAERVVVLQPKR